MGLLQTIARTGDNDMVEWWWIPVAFGIAIVGGALLMFILNIGSFVRYIKISSM